jgi:hypothetical protein
MLLECCWNAAGMLLECCCLLASYGFARVLWNSLVYGLQKTTDWTAETSQFQSTTSHITSSKCILIFCSHLNITCPTLPPKFRVAYSDCTILKSQCVLPTSSIWNSLKRKPNYINYLTYKYFPCPFFSNICIFLERTIPLLSFCSALHTKRCKLTGHITSERLITDKDSNSMIEK